MYAAITMRNHFIRNHLSSVIILVNVTPEVTKSVQPAVAREIGREESDGENEIIIELIGKISTVVHSQGLMSLKVTNIITSH